MRVEVFVSIQNHIKGQSLLAFYLINLKTHELCRIWQERAFNGSHETLDDVLKSIDPDVVCLRGSNNVLYYEMEVPEEYLLTHEDGKVRQYAIRRLKQLEVV